MTATEVSGSVTTRFIDTMRALKAESGWLDDIAPYRSAALAAAETDIAPAELAERLKATEKEIAKQVGVFSGVSNLLRPTLAGMLIAADRSADDFVAEYKRVRGDLHGVVWTENVIYDAVTIAVLMRQAGQAAISDDQIARLRTILGDMKKRHFWITGPEDLPMAASLSAGEGPAEAIAARMEEVFQRLIALGHPKGERLQAAAGVLALSTNAPDELARRFDASVNAAKAAGENVRRDDFDQVALAALAWRDLDETWRRILDTRDLLRAEKQRPDKAMALNLAAVLVFMELAETGDLNANAAGLAGAVAASSAAAAAQAAQAAAMTAVIAATAGSSAAACSASAGATGGGC